MNILTLSTVAMLYAFVTSASADDIRASNVTWKEHFGSLSADPFPERQTTFCLMARGFFRSPTKNIPVARDAWLKKHPKAKLVPVSSMPSSTKNPRSRLTYVWVVDGDENLNLELVRQGCFHPATQMLGDGQELEVPRKKYDQFVEKLTAAADYAREHKLGLWGEPEEPDDPND